MRRDRGLAGIIAIIAILATVVLIILIPRQAYRSSARTVSFTVTDKIVKVSGDSSDYLIFTDHGVYKNVDAHFAFWKTNSSDVYAGLQKDHTYTAEVAGWRIHILSEYPNIIRVIHEGR